jgi:hypothetical protein
MFQDGHMQIDTRDIADLLKELEAEIERVESLIRRAEERKRELKSQVA